MGVTFGYLEKHDNNIFKTPAVYIYTPDCYNSNLIISKEYKNKDIGYMIYSTKNKNLYFTENINNGMSDLDIENIIVLIGMICEDRNKYTKFISIKDIDIIAKNKQDLEVARKSIHIINMDDYKLL